MVASIYRAQDRESGIQVSERRVEGELMTFDVSRHGQKNKQISDELFEPFQKGVERRSGGWLAGDCEWLTGKLQREFVRFGISRPTESFASTVVAQVSVERLVIGTRLAIDGFGIDPSARTPDNIDTTRAPPTLLAKYNKPTRRHRRATTRRADREKVGVVPVDIAAPRSTSRLPCVKLRPERRRLAYQPRHVFRFASSPGSARTRRRVRMRRSGVWRRRRMRMGGFRGAHGTRTRMRRTLRGAWRCATANRDTDAAFEPLHAAQSTRARQEHSLVRGDAQAQWRSSGRRARAFVSVRACEVYTTVGAGGVCRKPRGGWSVEAHPRHLTTPTTRNASSRGGLCHCLSEVITSRSTLETDRTVGWGPEDQGSCNIAVQRIEWDGRGQRLGC
ncbi:hypothetical protein B0H17DRAFT_1141470 [Mycena rosella]|uniref:Uncharacterized protein n=1 Tax=Mycena rosella TaxID=1033263 RepID=A0AAD7CZK9_MYCRO|nr:hypothetical protein B0H17DRAFT_1141470 [Mycena rosella]